MPGTDYSDYLKRPVWPKAHRTKLPHSYTGSSERELADESSSRNRHKPLASSVTHGNRQAGTSGAPANGAPHPDDFEDADLQDVLNEQSDLSVEERDTVCKAIRDASQPEKVRQDFMDLFADPKIVISAKDVKKLTPDFGHRPGHREKHGWARFSLQVSDAELKAQNWPGKEEAERKKKEQQQQSGDSKQPDNNKQDTKDEKEDDANKGGVDYQDQKANREQDPGAEHGESTDEMSPEKKRFMDHLVQEAQAISRFTNASGEPSPPVQNSDGTSQIGYEIQTDDQFTPDNWIPRTSHLKRLTGKVSSTSAVKIIR
jgi:nitrate reductase (NAD(P)H)